LNFTKTLFFVFIKNFSIALLDRAKIRCQKLWSIGSALCHFVPALCRYDDLCEKCDDITQFDGIQKTLGNKGQCGIL
jgi:hypothetical protein